MENVLAALNLSATGIAAISAIVFLGALVQGAIGFGLNLVAVPVIAVFVPEVLPAAAILLAVPITLGSALRELDHVDRAAVAWISVGRLPGVVAGAWIVRALDPEMLALVIGGMVLAGVAMSLLSPHLRIDRRSQTVVGVLSGLMGTASSIGGPPLALLYQREPGPVVRATLGASFLVGTLLSIAALAVAGEVGTSHWIFAVVLVPAVLAGLVVSRSLHAWLDSGWLRPIVLAFSALAGGIVLVRDWGVLG